MQSDIQASNYKLIQMACTFLYAMYIKKVEYIYGRDSCQCPLPVLWIRNRIQEGKKGRQK